MIISQSFLIHAFNGKLNFHSVMDIVDICVPTRQIREFPTFSMSSALRHSPPARCTIETNDVSRFLAIFSKKTLSPFRIPSLHGKVSRLIVLICSFPTYIFISLPVRLFCSLQTLYVWSTTSRTFF
jgi:hypothetical protein